MGIQMSRIEQCVREHTREMFSLKEQHSALPSGIANIAYESSTNSNAGTMTQVHHDQQQPQLQDEEQQLPQQQQQQQLLNIPRELMTVESSITSDRSSSLTFSETSSRRVEDGALSPWRTMVVRRSNAVPVKRSSTDGGYYSHHYDGGLASTHNDGDDSLYLERMYDCRTWEMYRRITESRKKQRTPYYHGNRTPFGDDSMASAGADLDRENQLPREWGRAPSSPRSGHEMIFLFEL